MSIKSVSWSGNCGSEVLIVEFASRNSYKCHIAVDEIMVMSHSPITLNFMSPDEEEDFGLCKEGIREEVVWCLEHFFALRDIYRDSIKNKPEWLIKSTEPKGKNIVSDE